MLKVAQIGSPRTSKIWLLLLVPILCGFLSTKANAFTLNVVGSDGGPVNAYRYMVEEDNTIITVPGRQVPNNLTDGLPNTSISIDIHNSYAPVVASGHKSSTDPPLVPIALPSNKPYFITVMPDGDPLTGNPPRYALSGTTVAVAQDFVTVTVNEMPIPTAQIYLIAFVDHNPINNAKDEREIGLGGVSVYLYDFSGGKMLTDGFGYPLGTTYQTDPWGNPVITAGGPVVQRLGDGALTTISQDDLDSGDPTRNPYNLKLGELLIKNLAPGKYGIRMDPPIADDSGRTLNWSQTATIEGTPTIDAWVKAKEPKLFIEGFGTGVWHAFFGFVNYTPSDPVNPDPWIVHGQTVTALQGNVLNDTGNEAGTGTITGKVRFNHFNRPPDTQGLNKGVTVDQCWVGLNDALLIAEVELVPPVEPPTEVIDALKPSAGLYAVPCDGDGNFTFTGIPPGEYQIVSWDTPLDALFGFYNVTVTGNTNPTGDDIDVGDLLSFRWFGTLEGTVFNDADANGLQGGSEGGVGGQVVNLRFRDGSVYQATETDTVSGQYSLSEVFPFFKWLVVEVDFARFKAVSMTTAVDYGGFISDLDFPIWPSNGNKSLQPQPMDEFNEFGTTGYRTETGPVLTQAMHLLLNQTNLIDWGKQIYKLNENGGISGIVYYDTTRAEDNPEDSVGEPWQPGIPNVQVNLYTDYVDNANPPGLPDGIIDDRDLSGSVTLADVDNYPFGNFPGPEDIDRNYPGQIAGEFDLGDAIEVATTDSWNDNKPSNCVQTLPVIYGLEIPECADAYGTWNQVRPGVFDGGYAFGPHIDCPGGVCPDYAVLSQSPNEVEVGYLKTGNYIVEAVPPPHIKITKSQDKNVDFGEIFIPSPLAQPPSCVGATYLVPDELSLFPGVAANLAGDVIPDCDRKAMNVAQDKNAAVDFFMFTEVPKAARVVGFANNDLGAEFNQASPIFGEKLAVPWIPIAFRDWTGRELFRVYADEWGHYNALLPSTYSINVPSPSGVGPNMITMVLNDPIKPDGTVDFWYNPLFSVTPWTFNYQPGTTTYTDTPMVPVGAFTTAEVGLDTNQVNHGPVIHEVYPAGAPGSGPMLCSADVIGSGSASITITSLGDTDILNPFWDPTAATTTPRTITRDYGFGPSQGTGTVTLGDVDLYPYARPATHFPFDAPATPFPSGDKDADRNGNNLIDSIPLTVTSWTNTEITVSVPAGVIPAGQITTTGRILVKRDNGIEAELGVTLHIIDCANETVVRVDKNNPAAKQSIQAAIDDFVAAPYFADEVGPLILVAPGTYNENVIMYRPVRLQGSGPGSVFIDGNPNPIDRLDAWHNRIEPPLAAGGFNGQALEDFMLKNPFSENEAPAIIVFGEQFFPDGEIGNFGAFPLANVFNPGFRFGTEDDLVLPDGTPRIPSNGVGAPIPGEAIAGQALIDGFTLSGSLAGGGVYIFTRARGLQVSNNNITNDQGNYAGGISVGVPDAGFQMYDEDDFRFRTAGFQNTDVAIIDNKIHVTSGFQGAGGLALSEDSHRYMVRDNIIKGNFSRFHGGGIAHIGRSDEGMIKDNEITFNENFFGAILLRAGDGGGIYVGGDLAGGTGAGSVFIDGNLIQANMTGSGSGGGLRVNAFNGLDVLSINDPDIICDASTNCPDPWPLFKLTVTNNMIVNNIAALDGGGISLQDVSRAYIANNTIANNDTTATSSRAFPAGILDSVARPSGISSHPYSSILALRWQEAATQPLLPEGQKVTEFCIGDINGPPPNPACMGVPEDLWTNPLLWNNIVWHNNSFRFISDGVDPSTGANTGTLENTGYWDYGVVGSSEVLFPQNSIDSSIDPLFVSGYVNTIQAATVIDEGGNNINIRFTPFPGSPAVDGSDYHIDAGSPAIETGGAVTFPSMPDLALLLTLDFDDGPRPADTNPDIGADEYLSAAPTGGGGAGLLGACTENLEAFAIAFGSVSGTANYDSRVDYNTDSDVDAGDLGLFSNGFNASCN